MSYQENKHCQNCGKEMLQCDGGNCPFCGCPHSYGFLIFLQNVPNMDWVFSKIQPAWMTSNEFVAACKMRAKVDGLSWKIVNTDLKTIRKGDGK